MVILTIFDHLNSVEKQRREKISEVITHYSQPGMRLYHSWQDDNIQKIHLLSALLVTA